MKFYILAKDRNKKGDALEELTKAILEQLGYSVVMKNAVGAGGHEIDVKAKYEQKSIGETKVIPVICECKAHDKPVAISDWLKFLGKVLVERMNNAQTMGVMIALSGVNGNVHSNYDELPDKSFLSLVCDELLTKAVCQHYKLKKVEEIKSFVEHKTIRTIDTINLVYYEKAMWWLISFVHGEFTVLSNNLMSIEQQHLDEFLENLQEVSSFSKKGYRDVLQEEIGRIRTDIIARTVVFLLMKFGQMPVSKVFEQTKHITKQPDIDIHELTKAIEDYPCLKIEDEKVSILNMDMSSIMEFYRWYLSGHFLIESIMCDYYKNHIDNNMLNMIIHLQNDIELTQKQREDCLFILQVSPSALWYAIHPDPLILETRNDATAKTEPFNKFHTERFLNCLTNQLVKDLENQFYHSIYCHGYGITEYHVTKKLRLKFKDIHENKEIDYNSRVAFFERNGSVLSTIMFDNKSSDITKKE